MTPAPGAPIWDQGGWQPLPTLQADADADADAEVDVIVVGLGASGLAAVLRARERGLSVIGVDAVDVGSGAAGRNGGFALAGLADFHHELVARVGREVAAAAYRSTLDELDRMEADAAAGFRRVGSLRIAVDDEELVDCRRQLDAMRADDLPVEPYEGPEGSGLLFPADGAMDPLARCRAMARDALRRGARLAAPFPVHDVGPGMVRSGSLTLRAPRIIVAVDGGLDRLLPTLAGRVRTTRLQMLATAPTDEVSSPRPVYRRYGFDYWQQLPSGEVALGGGRDRFEADEWDAPAEPSAPVQRMLDELLREVVGVRAAPVTHRWAGRVGYTPDHLPIVEEVMAGVVACGGYCGTGNIVGVLAARAALDLALDGTPPPPFCSRPPAPQGGG